jgi:hypothetical protein
MPAKNAKQIKITYAAKIHLELVSRKWKAKGFNNESQAKLASEAILAIPLPAHPNGSTQAPVHEEEK